MILSNLFKNITQLCAPAYCASCKLFLQNEVIFCARCAALIKPVVSARVMVTATKSFNVFAASAYEGPLKRLVLAKGWSKPLASKHMAEIIWQRTLIPQLDFDYIVPIPLHWTRFAWRGYNQAEYMASHLALLSGKPMLKALKRIQRTQLQFQLRSRERAKNVENVFALAVDKKLLAGKKLLLVDDLMTTGATLKSAAKVLFATQPKLISGVVTCRVI